jgi:hypothetical protein
LAKAFVVDTDKAQQVGDRLSSIGQTMEGFPPGPQPRGPLGTGVIEQAWSELEQSLATVRQNLVRAINQSAQGFTGLAQGAINLDLRKADEVETI